MTTSSPPDQAPPRAADKQGPARVLVVDDDIMLQDLLKSILEAFGMTVIGIAKNGAEACELYANLSPDAVVMDLRMPVMDGLEALRRIRERDPEALVMMVTASHEDDAESRAVSLGCQGFLRKPFQVEELFADLNRGLRRLFARRQGLQLDQHYIRYVLKERLGEPEIPSAPRTLAAPPASATSSVVPLDATGDEDAETTSSGGAVVIRKGELDELQKENAHLRARVLELENTVEEVLELLAPIRRGR